MDLQVDRDRPIALPSELFRPILEHLSGHTLDLLACSKVSRTICTEAQRILFRVIINVGDRIIMFLNSVLNSPDRLALHVRVFNLDTYTHHIPCEDLTPLSDAFKVMHNLKHLRLYLAQFTPVAYLLRDVKFQLESLAFDNHEGDEELELNFLPNQRSLKYIRLPIWRTSPQDVNIIKDVCPSLECIDGATDVVRAFLAGSRSRPLLKTVLWQPFLEADDELAESLEQIEYLSYTDGDWNRRLPFGVLLRLKLLIVLEIDMFGDTDMQILQHLPKLEHLILTFPALLNKLYAGSEWSDRKAQRDPQVVAEAFAHSQTVQWVDVKSIKEEGCYTRWRRPSLQVPPERIGAHDSCWRVNAHSYRYRGIFAPFGVSQPF